MCSPPHRAIHLPEQAPFHQVSFKIEDLSNTFFVDNPDSSTPKEMTIDSPNLSPQSDEDYTGASVSQKTALSSQPNLITGQKQQPQSNTLPVVIQIKPFAFSPNQSNHDASVESQTNSGKKESPALAEQPQEFSLPKSKGASIKVRPSVGKVRKIGTRLLQVSKTDFKNT